MNPIYKPGLRLTIIGIGVIAQTQKQEIELVMAADRSGQPALAFKNRGKRKLFLFREPDNDTLVFEGWDIPVKTDQELRRTDGCTRFSGNACINLAGDPAVLKEWIETKNLNPLFGDRLKSNILLHKAEDGCNDDGTLLYPELYEGGHAVINRILANQEQT